MGQRLTRGRRVRSAGASLLLLTPALALVLAVAIYPLALSIHDAFTVRDNGSEAFAWIRDNPVYLRILGRTAILSLVVAVLCLVLGYPYAYVATRSRSRLGVILIGLAVAPFWISGLVRIFSWFVLLQPNGLVTRVLGWFSIPPLLGTTAGVVVTMAQMLLPVMILMLVSAMRSIDRSLVTAAQALGATPAVAFFTVFLPLSLPGIVAGFVLVFILSIGFYVVPQIVGSPTQALFAQSIYEQAGGLANFGRAGALALLLLVVTLLCLAILSFVRSQLTRRLFSEKV